MKPIPITAEQCPRNQLSKGRKTDMLENIIEHFETKLKETNTTHMQINHERPGDPSTISEIEKSYIETHTHPDNWQEMTMTTQLM